MHLQVRTLPDGENHTVDLEEGATGFELLDALGRNPEAHLLLRGRSPIPMDAPLDASGDFAVVAIISGGSRDSVGRPRRRGAIGQAF
ncbi:MAG: hypothetical protein ACE5EW_02935 [Thermoplasmata archaeon]